MSTLPPRAPPRGLVSALILVPMGLLLLAVLLPLGGPAPSTAPAEACGTLLLLAIGSWAVGYAGGHLWRKTDSEESSLSPGCVPLPSPPPTLPVDLSQLPIEQLYRELRRVNRAALSPPPSGDARTPLT